MPETTVAAIITRAEAGETQILLTRRNVEPFRGQWCLPGGHIDPYEAALSAVIREAREETGLEFEARFWSYFDEIIPVHGIHAVVLAFVGPAVGVEIAQPYEVSEMRWFSLSEARALSLAFLHNEILDAYVAWDVGSDRVERGA